MPSEVHLVICGKRAFTVSIRVKTALKFLTHPNNCLFGAGIVTYPLFWCSIFLGEKCVSNRGNTVILRSSGWPKGSQQ